MQSSNENEGYPQLRMVWLEQLLNTPPAVRLPSGYSLRTYRPGDEPRFYKVMELAGWLAGMMKSYSSRYRKLYPKAGLWLSTREVMRLLRLLWALHNYKEIHPFWGDLGWLAGDPDHAGKGLGMAVSAAVTARFIAAGYRNIQLYTEDFRLPALKTYLKLGYVPFLYTPDMPERWRAICAKLQWQFTPEKWKL